MSNEPLLYSELVGRLPTKADMDALNKPSIMQRLTAYNIKQPYNSVIVARQHNIEHILPYRKTVSDLPQVSNALIIGAGQSLTIDAALALDWESYDAILLTLPVVAAFEDVLAWPTVYCVDAEIEPYISKYWYGHLFGSISLICPTVKWIEKDWPFRDIFFYARDAWPLSSGAAAAKAAVESMGCVQVDTIGIDLSGHHARFNDETMHWLQSDGVRWQKLGGMP